MESTRSSTSDKVSLQTQQLSKLVCPVCYEYMRPPIMQCASGHGICELCHELLADCPICQSALIYRRSSHLEVLTAKLMFPCKKCGLQYSLDELTAHECTVEDTKVVCLIGQVYGECSWQGLVQNLTEHCRLHHPQNYWTQTENVAVWNYCHLSSIGIQNVYIVDLVQTVFVIVQKFDSNTQSLQWNVSCECEKEQYMYEIEIFTDRSANSLTYNSTIDNEENILAFFPSNNEISVPVNTLTEYLCDNVLKYKIVIHKKSDVILAKELDKNCTYSTAEVSPRDSVDHGRQTCSQKSCNSIFYVFNYIKKRLLCSK
ncbi:sina homologue [Carabus blaptoides fortunei]